MYLSDSKPLRGITLALLPINARNSFIDHLKCGFGALLLKREAPRSLQALTAIVALRFWKFVSESM